MIYKKKRVLYFEHKICFYSLWHCLSIFCSPWRRSLGDHYTVECSDYHTIYLLCTPEKKKIVWWMRSGILPKWELTCCGENCEEQNMLILTTCFTILLKPYLNLSYPTRFCILTFFFIYILLFYNLLKILTECN
jgi:hypothetical protein